MLISACRAPNRLSSARNGLKMVFAGVSRDVAPTACFSHRTYVPVLCGRNATNAYIGAPWLYAGPVTSPEEPPRAPDPPVSDAVRDPLAVAGTVLAARQRPMSERLELALSWNAVAAELRFGLLAATRHTNHGR
jgi:hypothetical protein